MTNMNGAVPTPAPFVGLRPFGTADATWFFGRERETAVLVRKIRNNRFTAVVGASGSGKSSCGLQAREQKLQSASGDRRATVAVGLIAGHYET